mmetsp:Transcript_17632/g.50499  ORF Transcript_17632/g.50499 Transcript_17632/m.50499 type:complete len:242 (+) Transcript_17632:819-1544(+)
MEPRGYLTIILRCHGFVEIQPEELAQRDTIHVVRNAPTIVALPDRVQQRRKGKLLPFAFFQKHAQLAGADAKVRLVELVRNVPTKWTVAAPLLHDGVENAEAECKPLEFIRARWRARFKELLIVDWVGRKTPKKVRAKALRRFVGHLDRVLENRDGEVTRRIRCQKQAKKVVRFLLITAAPASRIIQARLLGKHLRDLLEDGLECGHPAWVQVTVLQNHPRARCDCSADHLLRMVALPLPE